MHPNQINTINLSEMSKCSRKFFQTEYITQEDNPIRELIKRMFLRSLVKETDFRIASVNNIWDTIFWPGKEVNAANMNESTRSVQVAFNLYKKIKEGELKQVFPTKMVEHQLDAGLLIKSSCDFFVEYKDRFEGWIFLKSTPKEIRRSPILQLEYYLVQQGVRAFNQKEFHLITYYLNDKNKTPIIFRTRKSYPIEENRKVMTLLSDQFKRKISYPQEGSWCDDCKVKC